MRCSLFFAFSTIPLKESISCYNLLYFEDNRSYISLKSLSFLALADLISHCSFSLVEVCSKD